MSAAKGPRGDGEEPSRPPSEPGHKESEQRDIPPQALDRRTAESLLKKAAAAGREHDTPEAGVDGTYIEEGDL